MNTKNTNAGLIESLPIALKSNEFEIRSNFCNSIDIEGIENDTTIHIRVYSLQEGYVVDFSSVYIDERLQRKGLFKKTIENVFKNNSVKAIIISSVLTDVMHNFCINNGFKESEKYFGYIKVKKHINKNI